jgi:nucleoside-diphosphate-sugar epimerase
VVIGATGNVGTAVMRTLSGDERVSSAVGVARRLPEFVLPKVSWMAADIESDPLAMFEGADAVIHLAWKIQPQRDEDELVRTNLVGSRNVFERVAHHRVPSLIYASSVGAYSRGPKSRAVDESWPVDGIATSVYSRHKAAVEAMLDGYERAHPDVRVVRMRTSLVFQSAAGSEIHRLFLGPLAPWHMPRWLRIVPRTARLAFQATHATDIAEAYRRALHSTARGAFNIAAEPVLTGDRIARAVGGRSVPLPAAAVRVAVAAGYRTRVLPIEPGWLDMALETPIMDTARARELFGWTPSRSSIDAFVELTDAIGRGDGLATAPLTPRRMRAVATSG